MDTGMGMGKPKEDAYFVSLEEIKKESDELRSKIAKLESRIRDLESWIDDTNSFVMQKPTPTRKG